MYYEEKLIDGRWYWRGTPKGEWTLMSLEQLTEKIAALIAELDRGKV